MTSDTLLLTGALVIVAGVYAIYRRVDVRLALLLTALTLGALAGEPQAIVRVFLATFSNERFVVPICTAMGFAYVLKLAQCDRHLVHLLVQPLTYVRPLLIPGTVVVGFVVNIPIVSQTSTAVTLGAVIVPILLAARIRPLTVGAALLLGSSIGGELLNPGAPELRTIIAGSEPAAKQWAGDSARMTESLVARILPLNLLGLGVALAVFWPLSVRADRAVADEGEPAQPPPPEFRVSLVKAMIPILPLVLLFLTGPPLKLVEVPPEWLLEPPVNLPLTPAQRGLFDCRVIGAAMLVGVLAAALAARAKGLQVAGTFFEGAGYGFTHIISLIVTANCFGKGVEVIGLAAALGQLIEAVPTLLMPIAGALPLAFGALCGSGMASTQSLFGFFVNPAMKQSVDPFLVGAVVSLASAAGRTMSPFAAVTLMSANLTKTEALKLSLRVAPPLLAAVTVEVIAAMLMASWE